MSESALIYNALCLPAPDVEALIQGRVIAAMPRKWINPGQKFALYPANVLINSLPPELSYCSSFSSTAQKTLKNLTNKTTLIKAWATCELCQILDVSESLEALSRLTIWTTEALQQALSQRAYTYLAYLRLYLLVQQIEMPVCNQERQYIPLPHSVTVSEANPVLSHRIFATRRYQLETRQPPPHPELEDLESALACLPISSPPAQQLQQDIKGFLGWATQEHIQQQDSDSGWINTIAALGNRSVEQDEDKSNYQAGTDFENIVRKSLEFLGFTVDYYHKGGAGGVDVFCSKPYPLVGECKAGKKIPTPTAVQLLNLGTLRLKSQELFKQSTKLIIGPGEPTIPLKEAATIHGMAIINPETLEQLVKLQHNYRSSVDLFQLKKYLKPGCSDAEVQKYIQQVYGEIKLRSHLIKLVKNYLENTGLDSTGVDALHGVYFGSEPPQSLTMEEMHEILIELSSPLTGYLGRIKGSDCKSDRFYFLRDLLVTNSSIA
jgi:hypothetical protein